MILGSRTVSNSRLVASFPLNPGRSSSLMFSAPTVVHTVTASTGDFFSNNGLTIGLVAVLASADYLRHVKTAPPHTAQTQTK